MTCRALGRDVEIQRHRECIICGHEGLDPLEGFDRVELVRCGRCGMVFSPRVPPMEELVEHYEGYTRDIDLVSAVSLARREEWLDMFQSYRKTNRLLDVGCGVGELLDQARERGWRTYGTEFTKRAIDICRRRGHRMNRGRLDASDCESDSFDVVVYSEVIEHIQNQVEEFRHVRSLLRPGGLVFVTTPNFDSLSRRLLGERWNVVQYPEHLAYFTPGSLEQLMDLSGLETAWMRTTGISLTRFQASVRDAAPVDRRERLSSVDERIRGLLEVRGLGLLKRGLNFLLDATQLGDSIKAGFVKPEAHRATPA